MFTYKAGVLLLAISPSQLANAHTAFTNFFVDGFNQGDGVAVRMSNNLPQATFPIPNVTSPDMACGVNGETGVSRIASTKAGDTITFEWRDWPDGSQPGSIDISHKGPCAVYMKKVDNAAASNNAAGPGWFKIMEDGYDSAAGKWCTEKLIPNNGHLAATIPRDLAPGYYLIRPELLALHQADKTPPDPQFYIGCAQIFLASAGSADPPNTVSIPGYVSIQTPAMTFNIWQVPMKLPFPDFGPPVYSASSGTKRDLEVRSGNLVTQTIGLKPANCVIQNANWCGFMPPKYTDQNGCWASSQNCSTQTTTCYTSAGPTGSKNCHNFEAYCTQLRNGCASGNYNGPPSIADHLPPPLAPLNTVEVVYATGAMPSSTVAAENNAGSAYSSEAMVQTSPSPSSSYTLSYAQPLAISSIMTPVTPNSPAPSETGSIDTCGTNNGGQMCISTWCCSSHGYCGFADEYCGTGCQVGFGKCHGGSSSKLKSVRGLFHGRPRRLRSRMEHR